MVSTILSLWRKKKSYRLCVDRNQLVFASEVVVLTDGNRHEAKETRHDRSGKEVGIVNDAVIDVKAWAANDTIDDIKAVVGTE